jgi:hypothetical protein
MGKLDPFSGSERIKHLEDLEKRGILDSGERVELEGHRRYQQSQLEKMSSTTCPVCGRIICPGCGR